VRDGFFQPLLKKEHANELLDRLRRREPGQLGDLAIGQLGWTERLLMLLDERKHGLRVLNGPLFAPVQEKRPAKTIDTRLRNLIDLATHASNLARLGTEHTRASLAELEKSGLDDALAEFTAFLTPARWAYDPIQPRLAIAAAAKREEREFAVQSHGQDISRVLNTAELNTVALALYLLCAPRVANPWRVVLLDDPLQNLDELSVSTAARCLARLLRLWQDKTLGLADWELVLLLHGEDDCERVLLECPAAFYRLPWLAPQGAAPLAEGEKIAMEPGPSTAGGTLLHLAGFLAEQPA
jgi:hypothetical protein